MGAQLGRYTVLKHLASGGMADVLLGRADGVEGFERHVVLKRIKPLHAGDQRFIRMFLDEARVAANLHHQHIVQVHDVGEASGEYFIAMEYLHGEDVRTILSRAAKERQHVPLGCAIAIVSAAAAGLHYAHERRGPDKRPLGIVHRDISPSNILVGYDGSIKVVDFGIAKASATQETRSGSLKGKVSYMSPEQCMSGEVDRRSDVYALGVVLYELCTTSRLFKGENDYLVMDQIVNGRASLPQVRRPDLPNELSAIIMRAIARDPERRFATADELRRAIDQFAAGFQLTASTSAIAAFMRKQFGEKPEPWLELTGSRMAPRASSSGEPAATGSSPTPDSGGWRPVWISETDGDAARLGSGAVPRLIAPIGSGPSPIASPRTDSKMGWESRRPAPPAPRGNKAVKAAIVAAPLLAILGAGGWWFAAGREGGAASAVTSGAADGPAMGPSTGQAHAAAAAVATPGAPAAPVAAPRSELAAAATAATAATTATASAAPAAEPTGSTTRTHSKEPSSDASKHARKPGAAKVIESLSTTSDEAQSPATPSLDRASAATATPPATSASSGAPGSTLLADIPASNRPAVAAAPAAASAAPPAAAAVAPAPASPSPAPSPPPAAATSPTAAPPATEALPIQLSHALVDRIASDHTRELSKCDGGEDLRGEITVRFTVDAAGKVIKSQLTTKLDKPKVAACILRSVQKWQFPPQGTTGAQGTYTLSFQ